MCSPEINVRSGIRLDVLHTLRKKFPPLYGTKFRKRRTCPSANSRYKIHRDTLQGDVDMIEGLVSQKNSERWEELVGGKCTWKGRIMLQITKHTDTRRQDRNSSLLRNDPTLEPKCRCKMGWVGFTWMPLFIVVGQSGSTLKVTVKETNTTHNSWLDLGAGINAGPKP